MQFVVEIAEGDIVLAANGMTILGIGRVVAGYEYHSEFDFPHQRQVEWLTCAEWQMPESSEGLQSTVRELGKFNDNVLAIERRIQSPGDSGGDGEDGDKPKRPIRLKVLSPQMQKIFGTFGGKVSIQRSPPRWVEPAFVEKAIKFVSRLK